MELSPEQMTDKSCSWRDVKLGMGVAGSAGVLGLAVGVMGSSAQ